MLYMVEMDFRNPAREADWHVWYLDHVTKLIRNVPGFRATQRFRAMTATPSPWLAVHDVVSSAVFESKEYRANGGPASTGEWQAEHTNWYRNLFAGVEVRGKDAAVEQLLLHGLVGQHLFEGRIPGSDDVGGQLRRSGHADPVLGIDIR